ncbi:hypothetical protein KSF_002100 [Reticulibacter mediterranei]|uniref:Uncharacterized protein n=1 Tax=Reticulibacter mediterranei TaxID=2778369 RepID=A0A8J3IEJ8_9CHLR|nr:hypothetical protein [Reticulibacter mediterranei]GHO90162.1 hypothetical protein KSF_002100 [Reticulibacter mediterranei]
MDTAPHHEPCAKQWAIRYIIEPIHTSTITWSKTIGESSNDSILCMALETLTRRPVFVVMRDEFSTDNNQFPLSTQGSPPISIPQTAQNTVNLDGIAMGKA